ncbi:MAG: Phage polymerase-related protein [Rhodocyclaceae bacterium]|nr:Phage polymerase-related protein [Rhodocyclaceae bacterium]
MKLTREQMLAEMGITPIWRLRNPAVAAMPAEAEAPPPEPEMARPEVQMPQPEAPKPPEEEAGLPLELPPYLQDDEPPLEIPPYLQEEDEPAVPSRAEQIARLDWPGLKESAEACRACPLGNHRKQAVLGVGDVEADWLFIGEGPGAEEDERGEPFVGQAGKLLDNMLAAIDLKRGQRVYIANAVKCRPPGNRAPSAEEMAACRPYLERQIELIKPRLIVLLGRAAVSTMLKDDRSLAALRGKRFDYKGIPMVVTYHPAYLLRNLPEKAKTWEDLVFARRLMGEMLAAK